MEAKNYFLSLFRLFEPDPKEMSLTGNYHGVELVIMGF